MGYRQVVGTTTWTFPDLKDLMAKASPLRSGDALAGLAASCAQENGAAKLALADVPLKVLLDQPLIPYETDEVTRLICDGHDALAFAP
ncbi:MAG: ethanolamine ammonia-lyase subunit EutB, partial [Phenylobacterium sp.]|nr:ethanolamine ammonia-lyase subunit EutB [Phenylobacterium sp.]